MCEEIVDRRLYGARLDPLLMAGRVLRVHHAGDEATDLVVLAMRRADVTRDELPLELLGVRDPRGPGLVFDMQVVREEPFLGRDRLQVLVQRGLVARLLRRLGSLAVVIRVLVVGLGDAQKIVSELVAHRGDAGALYEEGGPIPGDDDRLEDGTDGGEDEIAAPVLGAEAPHEAARGDDAISVELHVRAKDVVGGFLVHDVEDLVNLQVEIGEADGESTEISLDVCQGKGNFEGGGGGSGSGRASGGDLRGRARCGGSLRGSPGGLLRGGPLVMLLELGEERPKLGEFDVGVAKVVALVEVDFDIRDGRHEMLKEEAVELM